MRHVKCVYATADITRCGMAMHYAIILCSSSHRSAGSALITRIPQHPSSCVSLACTPARVGRSSTHAHAWCCLTLMLSIVHTVHALNSALHPSLQRLRCALSLRTLVTCYGWECWGSSSPVLPFWHCLNRNHHPHPHHLFHTRGPCRPEQVQGAISLRCRPPSHSCTLSNNFWHKAAVNATSLMNTKSNPLTLSHTPSPHCSPTGPSPTGVYGRSGSRPSSAARNGGGGGSYGSSGGYSSGGGGGGYSPGSSGNMQGPGGAGGKVPLSQKLAATKAAYMQRSTPEVGFVSTGGMV